MPCLLSLSRSRRCGCGTLSKALAKSKKNHIGRVAVVYTVSNPVKKLQEVTKAATSSHEAMLAS